MTTGTFVLVCDDVTTTTGVQTCNAEHWTQVDPSLLTMAASMSAEDMSAIFNGVVLIVVLVFIIGMIKKAIEQ